MTTQITITIPTELAPYITKEVDEKRIVSAIAFYHEYASEDYKIPTDIAQKDGFLFGYYYGKGPGPNPYKREQAYNEYTGTYEVWQKYKIITPQLEIKKIQTYCGNLDNEDYKNLYHYAWN